MVSKNEIKRLEISADDGAKLVIWDSPNEGIPVILAHGFPQTHLCWIGILEHLDPLRGQYHFIGHDWGGATALHVARFCPEQLRSAVIFNTNYWRTDLKGMWHLFFLNLPIVARMTFALKTELIYQWFLVNTFRDHSRVPAEATSAYRKMFSDKQAVDFWIRLYRNMAKSLLRLPHAVFTAEILTPKCALSCFVRHPACRSFASSSRSMRGLCHRAGYSSTTVLGSVNRKDGLLLLGFKVKCD